MSKLYCCYSLNLRDFLYKNGLKYELCALNPNSKNMFWVYIRTEKLNNLLNQWSAEKQIILCELKCIGGNLYGKRKNLWYLQN